MKRKVMPSVPSGVFPDFLQNLATATKIIRPNRRSEKCSLTSIRVNTWRTRVELLETQPRDRRPSYLNSRAIGLMAALVRSPCIARPSAFPLFLPLSIFRCTRSLPLCIFFRRRSRSFWPRRARFLACSVPDASPSVPPTSCHGRRGRRNHHIEVPQLAYPIAITLTHPRK